MGQSENEHRITGLLPDAVPSPYVTDAGVSQPIR